MWSWCCCCHTPLSYAALPNVEDMYDYPEFREIIVTKSMAIENVKVIVASDTHMRHESKKIANGDILIIAGDITNWKSSVNDLPIFIEWLAKQTHKYKIVIAGNHELSINPNKINETKQLFKNGANAIYLQDETIEILGKI